MGSPEKGVALARSHTHSGILADRTVSQIIGVLLTVSLCQADHRRRNVDRLSNRRTTDVGKLLMNAKEKEMSRSRMTITI